MKGAARGRHSDWCRPWEGKKRRGSRGGIRWDDSATWPEPRRCRGSLRSKPAGWDESRRADAQTEMRGSEEVCWFTAANRVENLKEETQLTQWQDKGESALNADQGRKERERRKDAQGWWQGSRVTESWSSLQWEVPGVRQRWVLGL